MKAVTCECLGHNLLSNIKWDERKWRISTVLTCGGYTLTFIHRFPSLERTELIEDAGTRVGGAIAGPRCRRAVRCGREIRVGRLAAAAANRC